MYKILLVLSCWLSLVFVANAQKQQPVVLPTASVANKLKQLLPAGEVQVAVMDSIQMPPRYGVLMQKFMAAARANPEWFLEQQNKAAAPGGIPVAYDKRLGMTEPEFRELQTLMEKPEFKAVATYTGRLMVTHKDNAIHFTGMGKLAVLNEVWIDLGRNEVHMANYVLPYSEEISVDNAQNAFQSAWSASKWELAEPAGETYENMNMEKLRSMTMTLFQFNVGKLAATGKTFLKIKGSKIDKGEKKFSFDSPFFFQ
ncbi:hypothetical protein Q5H92_22170 [Hymenobacter sp. M29]|uniref:Uncharacterized protein n=1 Tax=Hymenobacter mellowenesis TaxID=3063995 RepID=A0ABT9AGT6_9BACT|nr:hypothetical protein [Hymenobacter sp. M29]MDO7849086.1 hypothetical protein [Hymenobacter sp. M29]